MTQIPFQTRTPPAGPLTWPLAGHTEHRKSYPHDPENPWMDLGVVRYLSMTLGRLVSRPNATICYMGILCAFIVSSIAIYVWFSRCMYTKNTHTHTQYANKIYIGVHTIHFYICIHLNTYIKIHTYIHTYIRTYVRTYIHTYIHTYKYLHTIIHTDIQTYRHKDIQAYRHRDIQTYRHTDIHTYIQYTCMAWLYTSV